MIDRGESIGILGKASNFAHERFDLELLFVDGGAEASLFGSDDHGFEIEWASVEAVADAVGRRGIDRARRRYNHRLRGHECSHDVRKIRDSVMGLGLGVAGKLRGDVGKCGGCFIPTLRKGPSSVGSLALHLAVVITMKL